MESEVKLNPASVRNQRESRSWTQEHLANAAGVSLRTIQRMESDGSASAESRLSIAAALGVPVESLHMAPEADVRLPKSEPSNITIEMRWGYAGLLVGVIAAAAGIVSGSSNAEQLGRSLGTLGALAGVAGGAIGVLAQRARLRAGT